MNNEQVKALSKKIDGMIEETMNSERFKAYIRIAAQFHEYSWNNQMLIAAQRPGAKKVAGYRAWQKKFSRHVIKGSKAISIFGHPQQYEYEVELKDGETETRSYTHWPIVKVFDISDTDGKELPSLDLETISDNSQRAEDLFQSLRHTVQQSGIGYEEVEKIKDSSSLGVFFTRKGLIQVATGQDHSRGELFKTLAHEFGHALYEGLFTRKHEGHTYAFEECVVETSAMIISVKYGLDIAPYDLSYVASWSRGDKDVYKSGLSKASHLAKVIIDSMFVIN
jgi:hypothetical protein